MNSISIVGAGPGAIDLLTLRAERRIRNAQVLVWADSLVSSEITKIAPKSCEMIPTSSLTLEEIIEILINKAKEGKKVVRLHDGDPSLYGAISEQICRINDAGINLEVIPGVSAYQAAAASLKKELTIPGQVQTIILTRASGLTGKPDEEKLEKLAEAKASLCIYLSARHVEEVQEILLKNYPPETPVAIGYRVSWPDEWLTIIPLIKMAKVSKEKKLIRTTLYIISPALSNSRLRSKLYNPEHKHLFRK